MFTPIFIPTSSPRSLCPGCHNAENTKTVCRNCDYEYSSESPSTFGIIATVIILLAFIFWAIGTLLAWMMPIDGQKTLVEVLASQWDWLKNLRVW